jgi:hypothetical protein
MTSSEDPLADLYRARQAAQACRHSAAQIEDFAERISAVIGPTELAEYANLLARDAAAMSERVEAFARLGLGIPSLTATDETG